MDGENNGSVVVPSERNKAVNDTKGVVRVKAFEKNLLEPIERPWKIRTTYHS